MKIKATKNVLILGEHVDAGTEVEVDKQTGRSLILINKAVEVVAKAKTKKPAKKKAAKSEPPAEAPAE